LRDILVLGLGNDIVADDRFGPAVIEALLADRDVPETVEALFVPLAGFGLLDHLADRRAVLIIDAIVTGTALAGTLHFFQSEHFTPTHNLCGSHQISLPTAIQMGRMLGYAMPPIIDILAAEAQDVTTITESMTPPVERAVARAVDKTMDWISLNLWEDSHLDRPARV
jgi:hydrogenase maturation protease